MRENSSELDFRSGNLIEVFPAKHTGVGLTGHIMAQLFLQDPPAGGLISRPVINAHR